MPGEKYLPPGPAGQEEVLGGAQRLVADEERRRSLQRVAVLVGVGGDASHPGHTEVEGGIVVTELLARTAG